MFGNTNQNKKNQKGSVDKKKDIMLNYDYLKDSSYKLRENDTFSIKRIGKFKYRGIIKSTKSNHYIVEVFKYI